MSKKDTPRLPAELEKLVLNILAGPEDTLLSAASESTRAALLVSARPVAASTVDEHRAKVVDIIRLTINCLSRMFPLSY